MANKWVFIAGAGVGYVLGTRAGREKYEQMKAKAKEILDSPTVKDATDVVRTEAARLYDEGKDALQNNVRSLRQKIESENPGHTNGVEAPLTRPAPVSVTRPPSTPDALGTA